MLPSRLSGIAVVIATVLESAASQRTLFLRGGWVFDSYCVDFLSRRENKLHFKRGWKLRPSGVDTLPACVVRCWEQFLILSTLSNIHVDAVNSGEDFYIPGRCQPLDQNPVSEVRGLRYICFYFKSKLFGDAFFKTIPDIFFCKHWPSSVQLVLICS